VDTSFAARIIRWQQQHGRHDLPWQNTRDPYRIWLSEIMLQQTQVSAVIPYYLKFLQCFQSVSELAAAPEEAVMQHWAGLGYYSRARNLHRAAQQVMQQHGGAFPREREALAQLPGVGRSTAAAIAALAFGEREAILDGNVKRVLARHAAIEGHYSQRAVELQLWALAEQRLPVAEQGSAMGDASGIEAYTQGLMDLGSMLCTRGKPDCASCPVNSDCLALAQGRQASLPTPRPKKLLPQRQTVMLLLEHQGEWLLEKRPPSGIWGGLWCFPELALGDWTHVPASPPPELLQAHCQQQLGCVVTELQRLEPLQHGFTHFGLLIHPVVCRIAQRTPQLAQPGQLWLTLSDAQGAAIPAPVKKLLQRLT
jgi:A/G-specific adenine glycosylase